MFDLTPHRDHDTEARYLVECAWPRITTTDVDELDRRVRAVARRSRFRGIPVHHFGSIVMPTDELVLLEFLAGSAEVVAETCIRAGISFQRVIPVTRTPMEVPL